MQNSINLPHERIKRDYFCLQTLTNRDYELHQFQIYGTWLVDSGFFIFWGNLKFTEGPFKTVSDWNISRENELHITKMTILTIFYYRNVSWSHVLLINTVVFKCIKRLNMFLNYPRDKNLFLQLSLNGCYKKLAVLDIRFST